MAKRVINSIFETMIAMFITPEFQSVDDSSTDIDMNILERIIRIS